MLLCLSKRKPSFVTCSGSISWLNVKSLIQLILELAKSLQTSYLGEISMGQNMNYTSECFMQETVLALAEILLREEMQTPLFSPC